LVGTIRNTTKELRRIAAQYTTSNKVAQLHLGSSDSGEASSDVAIQEAREVTKGRRKRCK
jgi:2-methylisocitrate lyase-like PEP mutase family enzyme